MLLRLFFVICFIYCSTGQQPQDMLLYPAHLMVDGVNWLLGQTAPCEFGKDLLETVKGNLTSHIKGQNIGVDIILNAIASWQFDKLGGIEEPLVLAITGPTGVGKSETAYKIADSLFTKRIKVDSNNMKYLPCGLLAFRGEELSNTSATGSRGLGEVHRLITTRMVDHLQRCQGNAVVVFDEVQKIMPGALEILLPAMDSHGFINHVEYQPVHDALSDLMTIANGVLHQFNEMLGGHKQEDTSRRNAERNRDNGNGNFMKYKPVTRRYSTANVIFILISDIGSDVLTKNLLKYERREDIPRNVLRDEIKTVLDNQWQRLKFAKMVKEVVPYMPLEPTHIKEIMVAKLAKMRNDYAPHWLDFAVDGEVVEYLIGPQFIKYEEYKYNVRRKPAAASAGDGAGGEVCEGGEGDASCSSSSSSSSSGGGGAQGKKGDEKEDVVSRTKVFSKWGARALDNAGPLSDLRSLLFRNAQPWRPEQILHVGVLKEKDRAKQRQKLGFTFNKNDPEPEFFIQWCQLQEHMIPSQQTQPIPSLDSPDHSNAIATADTETNSVVLANNSSVLDRESYVLTEEDVYADYCEFVWHGKFKI